MRRIGVDERRARLAVRHRLGTRAPAIGAAAAGIIALHATDPASVYLSAWARVDGLSTGVLDKALYDERVLVRMLGMRRTMFVVPAQLAPVIQAACTDQVAARLRRALIQVIEDAGIARDGDGWLRDVSASVLAALAARGTATAAELARHEPRLRERVVGGWAQRPDGEIATRLLGAPGTDATKAVEAEAGRLTEWLGPLRFTPKFRTPLERELVSHDRGSKSADIAENDP